MRPLALALASALLFSGCRDEQNDPPLLDFLVAPDAGATMVRVQGVVGDYVGGGGVEGFELCVLEDGKKGSTCTTTAADGTYTIDVPAQTETGLFGSKTGYQVGFIPLWLASDQTIPPLGIKADAEAANEYAAAGVAYPPVGKGNIWVNGSAGAVLGDLTQAGTGPVYFGSNGQLDPSGQSMVGPTPVGGLLDVPPGTYDLDVTLIGKTCTVAYGLGWPSSTKTVRVPVFAGRASAAIVQCK